MNYISVMEVMETERLLKSNATLEMIPVGSNILVQLGDKNE